MTDTELSRALGRLEGRLDAFERTRIERDQALDRQLAAIAAKLDRLNTAFNMGRGGASRSSNSAPVASDRRRRDLAIRSPASLAQIAPPRPSLPQTPPGRVASRPRATPARLRSPHLQTERRSTMSALKWILDRAKEPSTYAGLSGLALALGLSDAEWSAIATAAAAVSGAVAIVIAERGA
jgi:hypothetical protein